ncbi:hypothetical protein V3C33_15005 [Micrococcaceae bacterium Sec5.7]
MDLTLIPDVFTMLLSLAKTLGLEDHAVVAEARSALPRIPRPTPGQNGRLREWLAGDAELSPELEAAVSASLDSRGDESTGWSLAWKILLRARLRQPASVSALFRLYFRDMTTDRGGLSGGLYTNLFGAHPPFQIDGNFGFVAGLAECLVQSHRVHGGRHAIELLPALPAELPDGVATGLRARPGVVVSMNWNNGRLTGAKQVCPPQLARNRCRFEPPKRHLMPVSLGQRT